MVHKRLMWVIAISCVFLSSYSLTGWFRSNKKPCYPIVYSSHYDMSFFGVERLTHGFDGAKYSKIANYLLKSCDVQAFYEPAIVEFPDLLDVHTAEYLENVNNPAFLSSILEVSPLALASPWMLHWRVLVPMRYAVGGSLKALDLALERGYSINLGGGFHNAQREQGSGLCVYADIQLIVARYLKHVPNGRVLVVDLEATQGNGYANDFAAQKLIEDGRVAIFDVYNKDIEPGDFWAKSYITYNYPLTSWTADSDYLSTINDNLAAAIKEYKPTLVIYNSGTGIYQGDRHGHLSVSKAGIIERDRLVFKHAFDHKVPVLMLLSGGFSYDSADIVGQSLQNILTDLVPHYNHIV